MTSTYRFRILLMLSIVVACHARPTPMTTSSPALVVYSRLPGARVAAGDSVPLTVHVRQADDPRVPVQGAQVILVRSGRSRNDRAPVGALSDSAGNAAFPSLPAGTYQLQLRRIGYQSHAVSVVVPPRCPVVVEAYLGIQSVCLFQCPAMPGHVTVTTCATNGD